MVNTSDVGFLGFVQQAVASSITANPADGLSNLTGISEACLTFVPAYVCDDGSIDPFCLPSDPNGATSINFPAVAQGNVNVATGVCQADFTIDYAVTITGAATYTVNVTGDATIDSDDNAGNVIVTQTDPDVDDDGVAGEGSIEILDANGCSLGLTNLASFNATTCGYVNCPNLTGGTVSADDGAMACYLSGEEAVSYTHLRAHET